MDDRNLLERAAKAHGFIDDETSNDEDSHGLRRNGQGIFYLVYKRGWHNWNPLHDDGDEARLEAACNIDIEWLSIGVVASIGLGRRFREPYADHGGDKQKARRYAGVRAAAAMAGEGE